MKKFNYIYLIRNLINNKIYIGKHSTNNLQDGYMGSGKMIHLAYKKYGIENFKKTLLCLCDEEDLNEMEKLYIKVYGSTDPNLGYNLTFGGDGLIPTEETKAKISEHTKQAMTKEVCQKISESRKGTHFSDETKQKLSELQKGENNSFYGKHHNDATKKKISEANKGNQYCKGKHHSDTAKQKMSEAKKGKPKKKEKWLTPEGEIVLLDKSSAKHYHPDYILIEQ